MENSITIKEIARICGVGVATVSRAINNHPDINQETKDRVMEAIAKYGYVPNNAARNLKLTDGRTIAVLIKGITNPFFTDMIRVFESEFAERGYSMILQHVDEGQDETEAAVLLEKEKRLNGIVFLGGNFSKSEARLDRITVPFVLSTVGVTDSVDHKRFAYVSVNDAAESERMVEYLIGTGRKRIAIICAAETDESIGSLRLTGYLKALQKNGIKADPALILRPETDHTYSYENGYRCIKKLSEKKVPFDCVYAISDTIAIGAVRALHDCGKSIPSEVAVAGFDGIATGRFTIPNLTTMKQPDQEMARETVDALFEQLKDPDHPKRHKLYKCEMIIGESTK